MNCAVFAYFFNFIANINSFAKLFFEKMENNEEPIPLNMIRFIYIKRESLQ